MLFQNTIRADTKKIKGDYVKYSVITEIFFKQNSKIIGLPN